MSTSVRFYLGLFQQSLPPGGNGILKGGGRGGGGGGVDGILKKFQWGKNVHDKRF